MWSGGPCHLECVPCGDEEGLWQFRGGNWVDPEDGSGVGRSVKEWSKNPTGQVAWLQPENYGVPQFLEELQNGQNITPLGAMGNPHLAIFSGTGPPLPKGEATYNQWAFEVCSLQTCYQEEVL